MSELSNPVTIEHIECYLRDGFVVIPNVLSPEEVQSARDGLHRMLLDHGVDAKDLEHTGKALEKMSSTYGSGGVLDMFYFPWKLQLNEHPKVVAALAALWAASYARYDPDSSDSLFAHPFGTFDPHRAYMYIDRICYRLPSPLSAALGKNKKTPLQRSLTPHLDCCPPERFQGRKWRPIQAFVALTDTLLPDEGGLEVCPGMHIGFDQWAASRPSNKDNSPPPCVGQFTPIRPREDADIISRMTHVPCRAGDLVCFDNRLAHANALHNNSSHPREAVYIGLLPAIDLNRRYAEEQLNMFQQGILPNDQWHSSEGKQHCEYEFSELGRKLMTLDPW